MKEMKNNPVCKLFGTELPIVCGEIGRAHV